MNRVFCLLTIIVMLISSSGVTEARPFRPESALDLIRVPWQVLGYSIVFMPPKPGFRAMTFPQKQLIEVYARPGDELDMMAYDIAHELGHVIDLKYNTAESRRRWMQLRGIAPESKWFGCNRCSDYNTPAGDFAETFALILVGPKYFRGRIAKPPGAEKISQLTEFFPKDFFPIVASAN